MGDNLIFWLLNLPTIVVVILALLSGGALSAAGLILVGRILPHGVRSAHNEISGFLLAIVGTIYAVLLAFIAVAVWQSFEQANVLVQTEANLVGDLYRDTIAFPDALAGDLRHDLYVYAETVIQDEWPGLAQGNVDQAPGWQLLDQFHTRIIRFHTSEVAVALQRAQMLQSLNLLYDARRGRFYAATAGLPAILWWTLIVGAVILMTFTYLFGAPYLMMHVSVVSLLGALIGAVLLLIVVLCNPFLGQNHVSVAPFNTLIQTVETMSYPKN